MVDNAFDRGVENKQNKGDIITEMWWKSNVFVVDKYFSRTENHFFPLAYTHSTRSV